MKPWQEDIDWDTRIKDVHLGLRLVHTGFFIQRWMVVLEIGNRPRPNRYDQTRFFVRYSKALSLFRNLERAFGLREVKE